MRDFLNLAHNFRSTAIVDDYFPEIAHRFDGTLRYFRDKLPKIVCLCGSTKFKDEFIAANKTETFKGNIVLSVGCFGHSGDPLTNEQKTMLDELHKRKIDLADEVYVLNVGGYIGQSTQSEINYAKNSGKPIFYLEEKVNGVTI